MARANCNLTSSQRFYRSAAMVFSLTLGCGALAGQMTPQAQPGAQSTSQFQPSVQSTYQPQQGSQATGLGSLPTMLGNPVAGPIGSGDLLSIQVFDVPELVGRVRVDDAGDISLPFVQTIHVAGETSTMLEKQISQALISGNYVLAPIVSVQILETANRGITILGEVSHPGIFPAYGSRTLADAIALAAGVTNVAGDEVAVIRAGKTEAEAEVYPLRLTNGSQAPPLLQIYPGDTVIVRRAALVYVLGDVGKPGAYPRDRKAMTVLDAIALAQGVNETSAGNKALVLHRTALGVQSQNLRIQDMLVAKAANPPISDGDIIYVPLNRGKTILLNSIPQILGAAVGATIYTLAQR